MHVDTGDCLTSCTEHQTSGHVLFTVLPHASADMSTDNAGGKTASLKALGLMALMAKAGLFLPILKHNSQRKVSSQDSAEAMSPGVNAAHAAPDRNQPCLLWFDKVLADVGDGQNLQQSLSTFSGHVRRLCGVLAACTPRSLVLLDEVRIQATPATGFCFRGFGGMSRDAVK